MREVRRDLLEHNEVQREPVAHLPRQQTCSLPEVARNVDPLLSQLLHWLLEERESVLRDRGLLLVGGLALAHLVRYGWREAECLLSRAGGELEESE